MERKLSGLWRSVAHNSFEFLQGRLDLSSHNGVVLARQNVGGASKRTVKLRFPLMGRVPKGKVEAAQDDAQAIERLCSMSTPIDEGATLHLVVANSSPPAAAHFDLHQTNESSSIREALCSRPALATLTFRSIRTPGQSGKESTSGPSPMMSIEIWGNSSSPDDNSEDYLCGCEAACVVPSSTHGHIFGGGADLVKLVFTNNSIAQPQTDEGSYFRGSRLYAIYVAEAPVAKAVGFLDPAGGSIDSTKERRSNAGTTNAVGGLYNFVETWGEGRKTESTGRVFIADFSSFQTSELDLPRGYSYTSPQFLPYGLHFVVIGQRIGPFRQGTLYCQNREQALFFVEVEMKLCDSGDGNESSTAYRPRVRRCTKLSTEEELGASSFSVTQQQLSTTNQSAELMAVYRVMYTAVGRNPREARVHLGCSQLGSVDITLRRNPANSSGAMTANAEVGEHRKLVDVFRQPRQEDSFAGLYRTEGLPKFCLSSDGALAFLSTFVGCTSKIVAVELSTGEVTVVRIEQPDGAAIDFGYYRLHDVSSDIFLIEASSPHLPPRILLGELACAPSAGPPVIPPVIRVVAVVDALLKSDHQPVLPSQTLEKFSLPPCPTPKDVRVLMGKALKWRVFKQRHLVVETSMQHFNGQNSNAPPPLAVVLHGGPHAVAPAAFSYAAGFLSLCGFNILAVNYKGSLGFGQDELLTLPGKIGSQDVEECAAVVEEFISQSGCAVCRESVYVLGGSHGGFLTLHLLGQFPELFVAASARNPVANVASMISSTDIPDWAFYEGLGVGIPYSAEPLADGTLDRLLSSSPVRHVNNVITPLLLALGSKDKRVPPSQGLEFARLLRASLEQRGRLTGDAAVEEEGPVRVLMYPDAGHAIDQPEYDCDYWINTMLWFEKHKHQRLT